MDYFCTVSDTLAPFLGEETREAKCFTLIDSQMVFPKVLRVTVHLGFQNVLLQQALVLPFISQKKALHVL